MPVSSSDQLERSYTIILPGILGENVWDHNVASALHRSHYDGAIEVHDWTNGPLLFPLNLIVTKRQIQSVTSRVIDYQNRYPGRPVFLIGHSGGARLAVKALEALPDNVRIETAILLAPGLHAQYDLRQAMDHTRSGIHAYSSPIDVAISAPLNGLRGLAHGEVRVWAASSGFSPPKALDAVEQHHYEEMLYQHRYSLEMISSGHLGGHFGWTTPAFVAQHIAPHLK